MWGAESPNRFRFWTSEFERFYNPATGFDIDGAWIDMNEPTSVRRLWLSFTVLICGGFVFLGSSAFTLVTTPSHRRLQTTSLLLALHRHQTLPL